MTLISTIAALAGAKDFDPQSVTLARFAAMVADGGAAVAERSVSDEATLDALFGLRAQEVN